MEISFDNDKRGQKTPQTRLYSPTKREEPVYLSDDEPEVTPVIRPQPDAEAAAVLPPAPKNDRRLFVSRLIAIISIFLVAATAILALKGNVELTGIYSEINKVESEIQGFKEDCSLLKKQQSQYDDYNSINQTNIESGRVRIWTDRLAAQGDN